MEFRLNITSIYIQTIGLGSIILGIIRCQWLMNKNKFIIQLVFQFLLSIMVMLLFNIVQSNLVSNSDSNRIQLVAVPIMPASSSRELNVEIPAYQKKFQGKSNVSANRSYCF
jgi:hypothetical protein